MLEKKFRFNYKKTIERSIWPKFDEGKPCNVASYGKNQDFVGSKKGYKL